MAESLRTLPQQDLLHRLPGRTGQRAYLNRSLQADLPPRLPRTMARDIFVHLVADERTDLYKTLPTKERRALLPALSQQERDDMLRLSACEEGAIDSLTTSDYVAVAPDMRVDEALAHVRATVPDRETIYVLHVMDAHSRLCGTLSLRDLLLANDHHLVRQIVRPRPAVTRALWPGQVATGLIRRYDLLALPVLNGDERMIGMSQWTMCWIWRRKRMSPAWPGSAVPPAMPAAIWIFWQRPCTACFRYGSSGWCR